MKSIYKIAECIDKEKQSFKPLDQAIPETKYAWTFLLLPRSYFCLKQFRSSFLSHETVKSHN